MSQKSVAQLVFYGTLDAKIATTFVVAICI